MMHQRCDEQIFYDWKYGDWTGDAPTTGNIEFLYNPARKRCAVRKMPELPIVIVNKGSVRYGYIATEEGWKKLFEDGKWNEGPTSER